MKKPLEISSHASENGAYPIEQGEASNVRIVDESALHGSSPSHFLDYMVTEVSTRLIPKTTTLSHLYRKHVVYIAIIMDTLQEL